MELIHTLLKMAPTAEEELKLRLFSGELSQLGPAERFLKVLVDIPFAFKRLESLMFMLILREEATTVKESFATLEVITNTPYPYFTYFPAKYTVVQELLGENQKKLISLYGYCFVGM